MDTLSGVPFFQPLIYNRIPYSTDEDGYMFIDRDGAMFHIILQWLRNKQRPPEDILRTHKTTLLQECDFYGLENLSNVIRGRTCMLDLCPHDRKIREDEAIARENPKSFENMLIDVHSTIIEAKPRNSLEIPLLFEDVPRTHIKDGLNAFYERLNTFSGGILNDLKEIPGLIFAGGSVLASLTGGIAGDIDIFLKVQVEDAEATLIKIYEAIQKNHARVSNKRMLITRSKNAVTFYRVGPNNTRCPPVQVITSVVTCPLSLLLDFDVDSCCFAFDHDSDKVFTTPRGMRALKYGVNVVDSNFASPCYWRRLEKYIERGYSIAVPGYTKEHVSKDLKEASYVYIPKYELLVKTGTLLPGRDNEITYAENPHSQKQNLLKVKATAQQFGHSVKGLSRLIVLDLGLARYVNAPSNWLCKKHARIVCDTGPYSGFCTPICTGDVGTYLLLWGIEPPCKEAEFTEEEEEEFEGYQACPMASTYNILEKAYQQHPQNVEDEGWFKGGIMEKLAKKIAKSNTSSVFETSLQCNATKAVVGQPLHFVYDIVGTETKFNDLKYVLDAAQSPLKDGPDFEKIYGISRRLTFASKAKRRTVESNMFEHVY